MGSPSCSSSLVPLQRDLGLDVQWQLITGDRRFFEVTKRLHNGLQGMAIELRQDEREEYLRHNVSCAAALQDSWDIVVVHDPQPAAVLSVGDDHGARWIWRCHIDSSEPDPDVWRFLRPFLGAYDRLVFTMDAFVPPDLDVPVTLIAPAIDPLSSKNRELPTYLARETVAELGVDLARPLMIQVSRFDPWKDPLGVVETWRRARSEFPTLQLALVGAMAGDDPEGWRVYREIERATRGEPDCLLLSNQIGVNAHEVNALQRVADVAVQKSVREGFGLVVSETLWKGTPMVAGRTGGIPLQLRDGETGRLATTVEEFAAGRRRVAARPRRGPCARPARPAGRRGAIPHHTPPARATRAVCERALHPTPPETPEDCWLARSRRCTALGSPGVAHVMRASAWAWHVRGAARGGQDPIVSQPRAGSV